MKRSFYLLTVLFFAVVLTVSFTLQASDQFDEFGTISRREAMRVKIEAMRAELAVQGHTFCVDFNSAMQYTLDQLCNFKPELGPDLSLLETREPISRAAGKPGGGGSGYYMSNYTSVKNQGSCGSCWAFSCAGMFEAVLLKQGINTDLSEQWLVSCNTQGWGCAGGWFANSYYLNPGAVLESCFRYKAQDLPCNDSCQPTFIASGDHNCGNTSAIKSAIQNFGAVSCAVTATSYMQAYSGGVFSYNSNSPVNHAVVLVGWNDSLGSSGAWRMKNSWGNGWGESGMMWIEYGVSKIGYGANYLSY